MISNRGLVKMRPKWVKSIVKPIIQFLEKQQMSGFLLLGATVIALITANSPVGNSFVHFWETEIHLSAFGRDFHLTIEEIINDGLMTLFFIVVGLEIKRELIEGELCTREKAMLPVVGALGGMLFPGVIFTMINLGELTAQGWAIPTATDIAFSLTVISLLKDKVPFSLKVFLTALAIVDDLGAVVIIALFYSSNIAVEPLLYSGLVTALLIGLNVFNVKNLFPYIILGIILWFCLLESGIHATISGVILAMCVPYRFKNYENVFKNHLAGLQYYAGELDNYKVKGNREIRDQILGLMRKTSNEMEAPLSKLLHTLEKFSAYFIMPLFALSNAGVMIHSEAIGQLFSPLSLGIICGLIFGKSIGITLTTWVTCRIGLTSMPSNVSWMDMYLVNILAGIGFTMSIFVTKLAFNDSAFIESAKFSIILASFGAGILGYLAITFRDIWKKRAQTIG
ncbi:MAG: Na+/H+ antiporter NhaA [Cytophagales bacterium]|nr:Na+/H+ antiporter NhaA [Cytophagales bacterium]